MNKEFFVALDLLEKENGIPKEYMIAQIELALANSCRKEVGPTTVIRVQLDPNKKDMRVFLSACVGKRKLNLRNHILLGNSVLLLKELKSVEEFCVHFSIVPSALGAVLSLTYIFNF